MIYSLKALLTRTPIQISGGIVAILNAVILAGWWTLSVESVSAVNIIVVTVLGFFVNSTTTNTAKLVEVANAAMPDVEPPPEGDVPQAVVVTAAEPVKPAKPARATRKAPKT